MVGLARWLDCTVVGLALWLGCTVVGGALHWLECIVLGGTALNRMGWAECLVQEWQEPLRRVTTGEGAWEQQLEVPEGKEWLQHQEARGAVSSYRGAASASDVWVLPSDTER